MKMMLIITMTIKKLKNRIKAPKVTPTAMIVPFEVFVVVFLMLLELIEFLVVILDECR